jgi:hypothetical protein
MEMPLAAHAPSFACATAAAIAANAYPKAADETPNATDPATGSP